MKTSIVPAQITTVEDKVAGNLSLSQLLLLSTPVFAGSAIYIALPPALNMPLYKIVLTGILALIFSLLAIRIKGRILLLWVITIGRYSLRPRYFVFDKNSGYLRAQSRKAEATHEELTEEPKEQDAPALPRLSMGEMVFLEQLITDPKARLHFKTNKKGGLSVRISETKE
jgi:hypothetical protein